MNLHGLRLFYTVAEEGSITLASEKLMISQPAITLQLKKLESENDIKLFLPKGRGIYLTDIGERLYKEAAIIFEMENKIETIISDYKQGNVGTLRIACSYTSANFLLPMWVAEFKKDNRDVNIEISTMNTEEAVAKLISYEVDICLLCGDTINYKDKINMMKVIEDDLYFMVSPNHKYANKNIRLDEVIKEPFIMKKKGSHSRLILESICNTYGVNTPKIDIEFGELHETLMVLRQGYGVTFCPAIPVREFIESKKLARVYVDCIVPKNEIFICIRKDEKLSYLINKFISIIKVQSLVY
ncbi:MAG: LysR family transcriptional regulator [Clostridium perfringens]|nr:LysR family transcriptional regulator [Clostridium perfringens]